MESCRIEPAYLGNAEGALITNTLNGRSVYMPASTAFKYIRFRMDPLEGHNNRIADAYKLADDDYLRMLPPDDLLPCIKLIYTGFKDYNSKTVKNGFRDYGPWIWEEACKCLQSQDDEGRFDLADGFIVPNSDEIACIYDKMLNGGMNFSGALYTCANDITYPASVIGFIEDAIKKTNYPFYNIIYTAHNEWKTLQEPKHDRIYLDNGLVVPSSDEIYEIRYGLDNYAMDLTGAYFNVCNEILPPEYIRDCIESNIRTTTLSWEAIFNSCSGNKTKTKLYFTIGAIAIGIALLYSGGNE